LKIGYYKKIGAPLSKQKRLTAPSPPTSGGQAVEFHILQGHPMRIAIHYLFSTVVLSLYGGQV
jgi:hypothetical protein